MDTMVNNPEMAEPSKMVKLSKTEYDRLVKYGVAGESVSTALKRVLDELEALKKKK